MAVRSRLHQVIALGHFKEGLEWARELDEICRNKGLAATRFWSPIQGEINHLILESEYPDLAAFEKDVDAFQSDAEIMKVFRRGTDLLAPGAIPWGEMEQAPPDLA